MRTSALSVFSASRPEYFTSGATLSKLWWTAADRAIATLAWSPRKRNTNLVEPVVVVASVCPPSGLDFVRFVLLSAALS